MTTKTTSKKTSRRKYSPEFRREALALAEKIGVAEAAKQLGLHDSQLYSWRSKARSERDQSEVEQSLAAENARLKRLLAEQAEELITCDVNDLTLDANTFDRAVSIEMFEHVRNYEQLLNRVSD
ncbi:transposase, partial [Ketobacter sp. MCCC 1A13808]|uniref:transposase n=1 Tax=Ketobacter sp. MCCC 1A13808 TaxID=2602738 RepID=UPI0012EB23F2